MIKEKKFKALSVLLSLWMAFCPFFVEIARAAEVPEKTAKTPVEYLDLKLKQIGVLDENGNYAKDFDEARAWADFFSTLNTSYEALGNGNHDVAGFYSTMKAIYNKANDLSGFSSNYVHKPYVLTNFGLWLMGDKALGSVIKNGQQSVALKNMLIGTRAKLMQLRTLLNKAANTPGVDFFTGLGGATPNGQGAKDLLAWNKANASSNIAGVLGIGLTIIGMVVDTTQYFQGVDFRSGDWASFSSVSTMISVALGGVQIAATILSMCVLVPPAGAALALIITIAGVAKWGLEKAFKAIGESRKKWLLAYRRSFDFLDEVDPEFVTFLEEKASLSESGKASSLLLLEKDENLAELGKQEEAQEGQTTFQGLEKQAMLATYYNKIMGESNNDRFDLETYKEIWRQKADFMSHKPLEGEVEAQNEEARAEIIKAHNAAMESRIKRATYKSTGRGFSTQKYPDWKERVAREKEAGAKELKEKLARLEREQAKDAAETRKTLDEEKKKFNDSVVTLLFPSGRHGRETDQARKARMERLQKQRIAGMAEIKPAFFNPDFQLLKKFANYRKIKQIQNSKGNSGAESVPMTADETTVAVRMEQSPFNFLPMVEISERQWDESLINDAIAADMIFVAAREAEGLAQNLTEYDNQMGMILKEAEERIGKFYRVPTNGRGIQTSSRLVSSKAALQLKALEELIKCQEAFDEEDDDSKEGIDKFWSRGGKGYEMKSSLKNTLFKAGLGNLKEKAFLKDYLEDSAFRKKVETLLNSFVEVNGSFGAEMILQLDFIKTNLDVIAIAKDFVKTKKDAEANLSFKTDSFRKYVDSGDVLGLNSGLDWWANYFGEIDPIRDQLKKSLITCSDSIKSAEEKFQNYLEKVGPANNANVSCEDVARLSGEAKEFLGLDSNSNIDVINKVQEKCREICLKLADLKEKHNFDLKLKYADEESWKGFLPEKGFAYPGNLTPINPRKTLKISDAGSAGN